ncbi:SpaA isopeptide-forming pilin-related protein [Brevibacterium sp. RIT 803]|uniref:SpaA isopeptide-forming pilin-related protein n=1 Tax=Brevibacterium sp. RIT 803 TaxID=2810210 RepID=UPI00338DB7D2
MPAQAAVEPLPNPSLPEKCGLDISVVLDLSNSLSDSDVIDSKEAAKAVSSGLSGTPSRVSVNTFATFGPDGTNEPIASSSVSTSESVDSLNQRIDALQRVPQDSGGTNWDRGLGQLDGKSHDLVLFVTDGKPTAYGEPGSERGNSDRGTRTDQIDVDKAVESSNSLKSQGSKVVGLGVGSGINEDNIKLVSGPAANDDYYVISDYSELTKQLREIAAKSCRGSLNVTKLIDPGVGEHGSETAKFRGEGWTISSPDSVDGVEKLTNSDGTVSFKLKTPADGVQAFEEQQDGYRLQQQSGANAVCTADGREVGTKNIDNGFELTETVDTDAIISCQFVNEQIPGSLSWKKIDESGDVLAGAEFTLTGPDGHDFVVADNGELDVNDTAGQFEVTDLAWGEYTLQETRAPDGYEISEETQTVAVNGDDLEQVFSDVVNEKSETATPDSDANMNASADPEADAGDDASANPEADASTSTDPGADAGASSDPEADENSSNDPKADVDASSDPGAESDANVAADPEAGVDASTDPTGSDTGSSDPGIDASATTDQGAESDAATGADPASTAEADSDANQDPTSSSGSSASGSADGASAERSASSDEESDEGSDGGHLPRTGATGAMTFGGLGLLLVIGGIITVIVSKRRSTRQA